MSYVNAINSFIGLQSYKVVGWKRYHKQWIEIWLEPCRLGWRCGVCGRRFLVFYDRRWAQLRDLNIASHRVWLWVPRYRVNCSLCGVQNSILLIARKYARCTRRFERWLFELTNWATVTEVAKMTHTNWRLVREAEIHYTLGLLRKRNLDGITDLGIDEISEKKGHRYLTLVTDITQRRVIWVGKNRDRKVVREFFRWFGKKRTRRIKQVVIDMHDPYELEIRAKCPRAALIYDHFHVIKPMSLAIDNIRRRMQSEMPPEGRQFLKNSRYLLLRPKETLTGNQNIRLRELLAVNETLNMAYILKEDLRAVFRLENPHEARAELKDWKRRVRESGIPELLEYVKMLDRRRFGIMNFFKHRKTNGLSEGLNNVIKTLKKDAYGFHDWQYFRLKILRKCGKLHDN